MPLSPGDKLGPYEILSPIGAGGIQPLTRMIGVTVGSMNSPKRRALPGAAKANSEIHITHTTGAVLFHSFALVQQLLGNGFKSLDCRRLGQRYAAAGGSLEVRNEENRGQ